MKPSTTSSRRSKKRRKRDSSSSSSSSSSDSSSSSSSSSSPERRHRRRRCSSKKKSSSSRKTKSEEKERRKEQHSTKVKPSSSSLATTTAAGSSNNSVTNNNTSLLAKLAAKGETIEDREARRAARRAARITARFGYTPDDNPFHDPNLHEAFTWKKKEEKKKAVVVSTTTTTTTTMKNGKWGNDDDDGDDNGNNINEEKGEMINNDDNNNNTIPKAAAPGKSSRDGNAQESTFNEIDKVRQRRMAREEHVLEMDRLRAMESRMKELENYDEWARKEEEFHLSQQRQRSAIRLVEGRERPVDVLAQNVLLFGGSSNDGGVGVKYREKYSAFNELSRLEANLDEPYTLLNQLKLKELEELLVDVNVYRSLERDAIIEKESIDEVGGGGGRNTIIRYWDALQIVTLDEIQYLKTGGHDDDMSCGSHAILLKDIREMFIGQSMAALVQMKSDIEQKLRVGGGGAGGEIVDTQYWTLVLNQLLVHLAKLELSDIHSKMLVRQLEKLELRREELSSRQNDGEGGGGKNKSDIDIEAEHQHHQQRDHAASSAMPLPTGIEPDFGNLEEELGLDDEIDLSLGGMTSNTSYAYQDKYRPRKPRYFNRVKTGYDWNAYNKTHYDHDNPPPKTVQGYKFNVFYPDLLDKSRTPQYRLEKADTDEFCLLRFSAGPPYEDVAFKIINRQWNKSRKSGFRCTFERGVLSLYFNFASHWYRR